MVCAVNHKNNDADDNNTSNECDHSLPTRLNSVEEQKIHLCIARTKMLTTAIYKYIIK